MSITNLVQLRAYLQGKPDSDHRPSNYGLAILYGLQQKPVYGGTVPEETVQARRKAARVARATRKSQRG